MKSIHINGAKSPCMDCANRKTLCHMTCKNYAEYRLECEKYKKAKAIGSLAYEHHKRDNISRE